MWLGDDEADNFVLALGRLRGAGVNSSSGGDLRLSSRDEGLRWAKKGPAGPEDLGRD